MLGWVWKFEHSKKVVNHLQGLLDINSCFLLSVHQASQILLTFAFIYGGMVFPIYRDGESMPIVD